MDSTKLRSRAVLLGLILMGGLFALLAPTAVAVATGETASDQAPSAEQLGAISQNCATIKQSLEQLQYSDSRTRTYLGTTYETLANKFIIPLNLRLVKNNLPTMTVQSEFTVAQAKFKDAYTEYMKSLGETLATDCKNEPELFYERLVATRGRRAVLRQWVEQLNQLVDEQYQGTKKLLQELKDE